jgi:hypothetical protein
MGGGDDGWQRATAPLMLPRFDRAGRTWEESRSWSRRTQWAVDREATRRLAADGPWSPLARRRPAQGGQRQHRRHQRWARGSARSSRCCLRSTSWKSFVPTLLALRRDLVPDGVAALLLALGWGGGGGGRRLPGVPRFGAAKGGDGLGRLLRPGVGAGAARSRRGSSSTDDALGLPASLAAAVVLPLACWLLPKLAPVVVAQEIRWAALVVGALILVRHKSNIGRLLRGEEPRSGVPQSR